MQRVWFSLYSILSYLVFLATFLYAVGFLANAPLPKTIDSGQGMETANAVIINLLLLTVFAVQHTLMARPWFKQWWTQYIPEPVERTTYVMLSSLCLILIFSCWQPMPTQVWSIDMVFFSYLIWGVYALGWVVVLISTFLINHFDLFGLRQVYLYLTDRPYTHIAFKQVALYRVVRHPIMLGFIVAFWATPQMSQGHLLFALVTTAYILIAIQFEERDLRRHIGEQYDEYRQQVSMIVPGLKRGR